MRVPYPRVMKQICALLVLLMLSSYGVQAVGPDQDYVRIYSEIQQAGALESTDRGAQALAGYLAAHEKLLQFQKGYPDWNPKIVKFRLNYLARKIAALTPEASIAPPPETDSASELSTGMAEAASVALQSDIDQLKRELARVQSDNNTLQAKLREALSIRPAAIDPKELEKSQEQNKALAKEVDLLRMNLEEAQTRISEGSDTEVVKNAKQALAEAKEDVKFQTRRADQLEAERSALAERVTLMTSSVESVEVLRAENQFLKDQVTELTTAAVMTSGAEETERQLSQSLTELALLQSEADILSLEKRALEQRMTRLLEQPAASSGAAGAGLAESRARITQLERQQTELESQLALQRSVAAGEPNGMAQAEINRLEARLAVYEAEGIPYSVEELVLFRMSQALASSALAQEGPPPSAGTLVAEAERQFMSGNYQEAEATFQEILQEHDTNAFALANLASTQIEQGKEVEAEKNLRMALASSPNDAFALTMLGYLKFRQEQYDEALNYLGLAVQRNPDNAQIQNYLGVTLSQKGMRGPAETALRRAIQLKPGYADAHFNLALVYALQEPPLRELARWHYQKALQIGHARSTEMEQLLDKPSGTG